jgi:FkbM family methyltransferase
MQGIKDKIRKAFIESIPDKVQRQLFALQTAREFGGLQYCYSQQGEDLAIARYFNYKQNGFYIDIGAFHPFVYSNTCYFYKRGWHGINIEPNPDAVDLFSIHRPDDINLNVAIGTAKESLTYFKFNQPALNTFSTQHKDAWTEKEGYHVEEMLQLPLRPLHEILAEHLPANTTIDFMTIDVENLDMEVLVSNDWKKYRPELLLVERKLDYTIPMNSDPLVLFMEERGYEIWEICCGTLIFRKKA